MLDPVAASRMARDALSPFGALRAQPVFEWRGEHELHPSLDRFYAEVGPYGEDSPNEPAGLIVPGVGNAFWLPPLACLWQFQEGYRWHGLTGERLPSWPDAWLVVADQGGDPFILDRSSGVIYHALHGRGAWDAKPFCADIFALGIIFGTAGILHDEAGDDLLDEDCEVRPRWRAALRERLGHVFGSEEGEAIASRLEW